jgi:hypothetical protein
VAYQATPATLKAAFLDPIHRDLATDVNLDIFARNDSDFMVMFNGALHFITELLCYRLLKFALPRLSHAEEPIISCAAAGAVAALEARRDALGRRVEGLVKCKNEFQELARCL